MTTYDHREAFSYVRFSGGNRQKKGTSLARQTTDTVAGESPERWCARHKGVTLNTSRTFRDLSKSAYKGQKQRELFVFLELIRRGDIKPGSYLLVEKIDRISRKGVEEGMDIIKQILKAGVSIVTLAHGRVYGPEALTGLMKGLLELQMMLEQAHEFSETLSRRVSVAKQEARKRAREKGTLFSAKMPPWLRPVGEGEARRAAVIPERAAVIRRIFAEAIAGKGVNQIVRGLIRMGVPPISLRGRWAETTVRGYLSDRTVLGEFQPRLGSGGGPRLPDGPPIEGYYPRIISLETFQRARALMTQRLPGGAAPGEAPHPPAGRVGRGDVNVHLFSGLVRDAVTGLPFHHKLCAYRRGLWRKHVLHAHDLAAGRGVTYPVETFERAIIKRLKEVDPREALPSQDGGPRAFITALEAELDDARGQVAALKARLAKRYSDAIADVLEAQEARARDVTARLGEAKARAATPLTVAWDETKNLLAALDAAEDQAAARQRVRAAIRRVVDVICLVVVPRGCRRLAAAQVWFKGNWCRTYLILHVPPHGNARASRPGGWWSCVRADSKRGDLRKPAHAAEMAAELKALDLARITTGEDS